MTAVIIRIALRYLAGVLVARGFITIDDAHFITTDPELIDLLSIALGTAAGFVAEMWWRLAKKLGWET